MYFYTKMVMRSVHLMIIFSSLGKKTFFIISKLSFAIEFEYEFDYIGLLS